MTALASVGSVVSSLLALQVAQALLTAVVLWVFQRRFGHPVLVYWTYGWLALVGQLVAVATYGLFPDAPPTHPAIIALAVVTLTFGYLKVIWLGLGAFALAERREISDRLMRATIIGAVGVAIATTLPYATVQSAGFARYVARIGVLAVLTGGALIVAGTMLWVRTIPHIARRAAHWMGASPDGAPALGQRLVASAFLVLGTLFVIALAHGLTQPHVEETPPIVPPLEGTQVLLHFALGLGLVIWLLEGEQRRTLEAAQRAEHMAYHDALTGLPNRLLLIDRLRFLVAHARRTRQPFAVFFLDVDHFKVINDTLGHAAGDRLLQQVAARLTAQLREADTVARLGGDEFVVLTPDLRQGADVTAVGEKLLEAVRAPITLDDREVRVTVSIGVSVFPEDGDDADALLRRSDSALYLAKEEGRDAVRLA